MAQLGKNPQTDLALASTTPEYAEYLRGQRDLALMMQNKEKLENLRSKEKERKPKEEIDSDEELSLIHKALKYYNKKNKHSH